MGAHGLQIPVSPSFLQHAGRWRFAPWQMPSQFYHEGLRAQPFWLVEDLPQKYQRVVELFEKNREMLRTEAGRLYNEFGYAEFDLNHGSGEFKELLFMQPTSEICASKKLCELLDAMPLVRDF